MYGMYKAFDGMLSSMLRFGTYSKKLVTAIFAGGASVAIPKFALGLAAGCEPITYCGFPIL